MSGKVYLVGAGPGDARLLTLRAAELIAKADFVALDALVSPEIAAMVTAESTHAVPQDEINQLLIDEARKGKLVVRLKGGDPFVFGRGGEEAEELAAAGVEFEIVPGVASAIAGPAYAGKPLFGKRIVVTRAREQASDFTRLLEESGAQVVQFPMISIEPPVSFDALDRAIDEHYDWLVFTSTNGARFFFERLFAKGKDVRALAGRKIAAVGQTTAAELRARGLAPDVVPERFISTELLPLLPQDQRGLRTAVIRAEEGREELLDELRQRGGEVHLAVAYRNVATDTSLDDLGQGIDVVTFTSASTVDNFFARVSDTRGARLASIGPATSAAIRKHGREPDIEAKEATIQALHDALL